MLDPDLLEAMVRELRKLIITPPILVVDYNEGTIAVAETVEKVKEEDIERQEYGMLELVTLNGEGKFETREVLDRESKETTSGEIASYK